MKKFAGYWKKGLPKIDNIDWKPVVDNNTRAVLMQTGEADFAFSVPFEQAAMLKVSPKVDLIAVPSIIQRYISMNVQQKPFDNPKVREALNYAINKEALVKVAFAGYAVPAEGVVPPGVDYATKLGLWKYDPAKAGPEDRAGAHVLHRLVVVDGRSGLGICRRSCRAHRSRRSSSTPRTIKRQCG